MSIKKEDVLANLEEVKKYILEAETKKEENVVGLTIKNHFTGSIIFQSTKTTFKEAVKERLESSADLRKADLSGAYLRNADLRNAYLRDADLRNADLRDADLRNADLRDADLRNADLRDADLRDAELNCAKFYGKGGTKQLKRSQLPSFLEALGFVIVD